MNCNINTEIDNFKNSWLILKNQWKKTSSEWKDNKSYKFKREIWDSFDKFIPLFLSKSNETKHLLNTAYRSMKLNTRP